MLTNRRKFLMLRNGLRRRKRTRLFNPLFIQEAIKLMRPKRIKTSDKLAFWELNYKLDFKEFVILARKAFNYSDKTVAGDIYESFRRVAHREGWGTRHEERYPNQ